MKFSDFLNKSRENKGLSFRQLESHSDGLDHAYIYRLSKGKKTSPSKETVHKLAKALELTKRELEVFNLLSGQDVDDSLVAVMIDNAAIGWEVLEAAATMSNRGKRPTTETEWLAYVKKIESLFDE